jgi:hypothetical protein
MYIKPGYTPPGTSPPPVDAGKRLLTLPRHDGELRISISQYQGNDYLSLRVWEPGAYDPGLYPTKKGVSIRISEIDHVISALEHAREIVEGEDPGGKGIASPKTSVMRTLASVILRSEVGTDDPRAGPRPPGHTPST